MTDRADATGPAASGGEPVSTTATESDGSNDRIESRLRAVERAVTGTDARPADIAGDAEATAERERLESRLDDLEDRVAELEAATQAVRGYAGAVRAVNREVERRADLALARATAAERETDGGEGDDAAVSPDDAGADSPSRRRDATPAVDVDGAVPSESALDAALPDDRPASGPRAGGDHGDTGGDGGDGSNGGDGGAWAGDALDRLRESL
ncbi:hypothetical protein EKH57_10405 [Halorubrum sp. BOL3-1]|uniref:DUF7310 family coiled-coil domain-containing protein n=1 Tax=Halorubrum sp. BOL3-1 TaxID=2497325 RepID=UPI00100525D4|nr:hypothetical protein [Halorubrum sp. BOL3-1]QAU13097.1 hypothetical protein EKH57_10405 [Halorubrum sp. BOL3-1]